MWIDRLTTALLVIVGAVNLLPSFVALAPSRITTAYGITVDGADAADLTVLLRHRAVLLGLVGIGLLCAAFIPSLRVPAMVAGAVSMGTFLLFAYATPGLNSATMRVARIDIAALALLAVAAVLVWRKAR
ncbi:hypothetical protein NX801_22500 [Streptomyces sp. LP05-1]|uniref:Phosphopantetheine adenylyltransferase n=1 Tax=Streptomyces pyxinae TaxID=2970734 RepID=A0ABT2CLR6_9ACTN|nr:hypothetical protein [Streptomyces sp. LP05-1]MCS0638373.1 hypothetical protein [Streptomyces sp. LP05-1]